MLNIQPFYCLYPEGVVISVLLANLPIVDCCVTLDINQLVVNFAWGIEYFQGYEMLLMTNKRHREVIKEAEELLSLFTNDNSPTT